MVLLLNQSFLAENQHTSDGKKETKSFYDDSMSVRLCYIFWWISVANASKFVRFFVGEKYLTIQCNVGIESMEKKITQLLDLYYIDAVHQMITSRSIPSPSRNSKEEIWNERHDIFWAIFVATT